MKRFIIEQSDEEFYTSHSGIALVGLALNRFTSLSSALAVMDAPGDLIAGIDIIRSYCALLAQSKSDFVAVEQYRGDDFFWESLGNKDVPSEGTMRQRMDEYAERIMAAASWASIEFLERTKVHLTALSTGHIPLDLDGFVLDNSGSKKEKVQREAALNSHAKRQQKGDKNGSVVREQALQVNLRSRFSRIQGIGDLNHPRLTQNQQIKQNHVTDSGSYKRKDIDRTILHIVDKFNTSKFVQTVYSCGGHKKDRDGGSAYIVFEMESQYVCQFLRLVHFLITPEISFSDLTIKISRCFPYHTDTDWFSEGKERIAIYLKDLNDKYRQSQVNMGRDYFWRLAMAISEQL